MPVRVKTEFRVTATRRHGNKRVTACIEHTIRAVLRFGSKGGCLFRGGRELMLRKKHIVRVRDTAKIHGAGVRGTMSVFLAASKGKGYRL